MYPHNHFSTWLVCLVAIWLSACGRDADERLAEARAQHQKGEINAAILQLKSSLQESPEHGESRYYLGTLHLESGDYRSAEKELKRALDLRVDPGRVLPRLAKALVLQGEPRRALAEVSVEGLRDPGVLGGVLAAHGLAYLALRQDAEAESTFARALELKPGDADARLGLARLHASRGRFDQAMQEVEQIVSQGGDAEALLLKAELLRAVGRLDDAAQAYRAVVAKHPGHVSALLSLVSLAISAGNLDEASRQLQALRKAAPGNLMVSYFQSLLHFRKGDFKAARDSIAVVLKAAPNHLPSVLLGGAVDFALGSQELAQTRLKYVLERAPNNSYARRLLIASYTRAGQTHKAMELLEPALKQGSKDPALLALAGEVHMQINEFDKARRFFEQAAAIDPANPAMRTGLGLSRLAAGQVELATADLQSASELDGSKHHADVLLVSTHLQRRQYPEALKAALALEKKQPDNPMTHNLLAAAHIGNGDIPAARRSLDKALSLQPGYVPAAANLAQLDLRDGNKKAARQRFEDMIARNRSNVQAYIALASLAPQLDASPREIQGWLEAARRESPGTIQPLVLLARFHFQSGEPKKALEIIEKAVIESPDNAEVLDLAGQVQLAAGERNRALATFSRWVTAQPNSPQALYRLATAQLANADERGAVVSLGKAIQLRPQFAEAQVLLADLESRAGRHTEAMKVAEQLQRQSPKSPLGWIVEGDTFMAAKKFGPAVTAYQAALERGRAGSTVVKLHAALVHDGRASEGERRIKEWIRTAPRDYAAQLYLAEYYLKAERHKDAVSIYESLDKAMPENLVVLNNLAWCYHQVRDPRAVQTAERALKLQPENAAVLDTLGWILVDVGSATRGVELLRKASTLAPKAAAIRFHYAQGLFSVGDRARAKDELERLLVDFPKFEEKEKAMKLLQDIRKGSTQS